MKDHLLKSLDYLYNKKPSEWDVAIITRFKMFLLPDLITFISAAEDQPDLVEEAKKIFEIK